MSLPGVVEWYVSECPNCRGNRFAELWLIAGHVHFARCIDCDYVVVRWRGRGEDAMPLTKFLSLLEILTRSTITERITDDIEGRREGLPEDDLDRKLRGLIDGTGGGT